MIDIEAAKTSVLRAVANGMSIRRQLVEHGLIEASRFAEFVLCGKAPARHARGRNEA